MSKTKEKKELRRKERLEFILARRMQQVALFKNGFEIGDKLFNDNKDKLSEEEIKQITEMRTEQLALLKKVEDEIEGLLKELDDPDTKP